MAEVISLHRCGRCGGPGHQVDVTHEDQFLFSLKACDACITKTEDELEQVAPIFDAMIKAGVERGLANEVMTYLLDRMEE